MRVEYSLNITRKMCYGYIKDILNLQRLDDKFTKVWRATEDRLGSVGRTFIAFLKYCDLSDLNTIYNSICSGKITITDLSSLASDINNIKCEVYYE